MSKKTCIGTKIVDLTPMSRQTYNDLRGWTLPADEDGDDEGFLVEYHDGGKPNVEGYKGYISWSPKEVAVNAYKPLDEGVSLSSALTFAMTEGASIRRKGWFREEMYVVWLHEDVRTAIADYEAAGGLYVNLVDGQLAPWVISQIDVVTEDWIVEFKR